MKLLKMVLVLAMVSMGLLACDKRDEYIYAEHDPDLIGGVWQLTEYNYVHYIKFAENGKLYYADDDDDYPVFGSYSCFWRSKDGYIYEYRYNAPWSRSHKAKKAYSLSEDKTELTIEQKKYLRMEEAE